uniref:Uncharacterized protein n=1 Tax=Arundo donax TaxID=35708 RepID=A0A0A9GPQ4_ARUDO
MKRSLFCRQSFALPFRIDGHHLIRKFGVLFSVLDIAMRQADGWHLVLRQASWPGGHLLEQCFFIQAV